MTFEEFRNGIESIEDFFEALYSDDIGDASEFMSDCDYISGENIGELIDDGIREELRYESWTTVRDELCSIDEDASYYRNGGGLCFEALSDNDLASILREFEEWSCDRDIFDTEDENNDTVNDNITYSDESSANITENPGEDSESKSEQVIGFDELFMDCLNNITV